VTPPDSILNDEVADLIRRALDEDVGSGDLTTQSLVSPAAVVDAAVVAAGDYIFCGAEVGESVFKAMDPHVVCRRTVEDGTRVEAEQTVMQLRGGGHGILAAERTALNFMQRMTGIATLTRSFVDRVSKHGVTILDTRKTTPSLRVLEKYAVRCGGGENHRMGLFDRVLIKDNHRRLWARRGDSRLDAAVAEARERCRGVPIEVEVENEDELGAALKGGPDWILLDNMSPEDIHRCVRLCAGRARVEASGGITLDNVEQIAATGVDAISLGCLTHSAPSADLSLELRDDR